MEKQIKILCLHNFILTDISKSIQWFSKDSGNQFCKTGTEDGHRGLTPVVTALILWQLTPVDPWPHWDIVMEKDEKENSPRKCVGRNIFSDSCRKSFKCCHSPALHLHSSPSNTDADLKVPPRGTRNICDKRQKTPCSIHDLSTHL